MFNNIRTRILDPIEPKVDFRFFLRTVFMIRGTTADIANKVLRRCYTRYGVFTYGPGSLRNPYA